MQKIVDDIYLFSRTLVLEGKERLALIDPGCDAYTGNISNTSVEGILNYAQERHKPVSYIFITHNHGDHVANLRAYRKNCKDLRVIAHRNNSLNKDFKVPKETTVLEMDGFDYTFIPTPGHSYSRDDLSIYLPKQKLLHVGDLAQPQGHSYQQADNVSPVPFFCHGEDYLASLENLLTRDFAVLVTGHGGVFQGEQAKQPLQITRQVLTRIKELSKKLVDENPSADLNTVCEWIFDTIAYERNFDRRKVEWRKQNQDYQSYDLPGIMFFVDQALNSSHI